MGKSAILFFARVGLVAMLPIAMLAHLDVPSVVHVVADPVITLLVACAADALDQNVAISVSVKRK